MPDTNPITQVYDAIWDCLEADSDFAALFPATSSRKIKYVGGARHPEKLSTSPADYPLITVLNLGLRPDWYVDSSEARLITVWSVEIMSGTEKMETLCNLDWTVYKALLTGWKTYIRDALTYGGVQFVCEMQPAEVGVTIERRKEIRNIKDWFSIWVGEVSMFFQRSAL